jgi:3-methyladenine DNA glycosylase AlkD
VRLEEILKRLRDGAQPDAKANLERFGITARQTYGWSIPALRELARETGRDHTLAQQLWATGILDARILASLVDEPDRVTPRQMEQWARDFDSWAVCDACCSNLFDRTPYAHVKVRAWSGRKEEFVKRASFALMAALAVHEKDGDDDTFRAFLPLVEREAGDARNFVKKAVNWALRQIGKRNPALRAAAIASAERIAAQGSPSARWIASDALKELTSDAVEKRQSRPAKAGAKSGTAKPRPARAAKGSARNGSSRRATPAGRAGAKARPRPQASRARAKAAPPARARSGRARPARSGRRS